MAGAGAWAVALTAPLVAAWRQIRTRTHDMPAADARPVVASVQARRGLPSQWIPDLTGRRIIDG